MNIICVGCGFAMKRCKAGVTVAEMFKTPEEPYKLWSADSFQCQTESCDQHGTIVVSSFGDKPFAEHFEFDFAEKLTKHPPAVLWHERRGQ